MEKFLTKENMDIANIRNEMLVMKTDLQKYSDDADKEILQKLDAKYEIIINKLDKRK